jgi:hypothetical protein
MLRHDTATVLLFRDSALRRPIDVVAWMNTHVPQASEADDGRDNVIPLGRFPRAADRRGCQAWFDGPPDGEAA